MPEVIEAVPEEVRAYMSRIGSRTTVAKSEAARTNVAKAREARRRDPLTLICTCTGGESLNAADHKTTCPRGRLLYQRERAAQRKAAQESAV